MRLKKTAVQAKTEAALDLIRELSNNHSAFLYVVVTG